jgi:hypothetical protein
LCPIELPSRLQAGQDDQAMLLKTTDVDGMCVTGPEPAEGVLRVAA